MTRFVLEFTVCDLFLEYAVVEFIESGELNLFVWDLATIPRRRHGCPAKASRNPCRKGEKQNRR